MSFKGLIGEVVEIGRGDAEISSFEWRIPDFPSLASEVSDRYESPAFDACGGRWVLIIFPNGLWRGLHTNWVNFILIRVDGGPPQTLDVTLGIRGAEGVENKKGRRQEFSDDDCACFWYTFYLRSKLIEQKSVLMPGNVLIVSLDMKSVVPSVARDLSTLTIEESKQAEAPTEENQSAEKQGVEEMQKSLRGLLAGGEDSDVLIRVRGKEFPAHRAILRARSPVFRAMFAHDTVERKSGTVTVEDCDQETFPDFLEHVYTGSNRMISAGNVFSLYASSEKYDLPTLKRASAEFLKRNLTVASFCETILLAIKYEEKELVESATEFFCCNTLDIVQTPEWQIFLAENSTIGNELYIKQLRK